MITTPHNCCPNSEECIFYYKDKGEIYSYFFMYIADKEENYISTMRKIFVCPWCGDKLSD